MSRPMHPTIDFPREEDLPALIALWQEAFGDTAETVETFLNTGFSPDRCRLIRDGASAAAALYWLDCEYRNQKYAYLYAVATARSHRRQGLCRALLNDTHTILTERGYAGALLVPETDALARMYGAYGYNPVCTRNRFSCTAGNNPLPLKKIDAAHFAHQRRTLLPKDGVLQEGASLAYLGSYAGFYEGNGILLTAVETGSELFAPELLGPADAAPGILAALGKTAGTFCTPGKNMPHGMFKSLRDYAPIPRYLAFDFG